MPEVGSRCHVMRPKLSQTRWLMSSKYAVLSKFKQIEKKHVVDHLDGCGDWGTVVVAQTTAHATVASATGT